VISFLMCLCAGVIGVGVNDFVDIVFVLLSVQDGSKAERLHYFILCCITSSERRQLDSYNGS
jgi:hypothetical protein